MAERPTTINDRLLSVAEIAVYLGVTPETVRDWIAADKLPATRLGRRGPYRVRLDHVVDGFLGAVAGNR